ncbi:Hypothetical predicted protein [Lecanosticta acicola]|uniref:Uncharacterized protein n=1 Tax=Lecanosticta acicola TaxID=111012 RepID=A0AAI8Z9P0_9PEZI|nr:Hypothetical predicted protein [Lecanosticta acicola]
MPSPNDARKATPKKTPEKKTDFGPQLARKRSQDFAAKIQGWNQAGGGIVQQQDEVVVIAEPESAVGKVNKEAQNEILVETETIVPAAEVVVEEILGVTSSRQKRPRSPTKATPKTSGAPKSKQEVDLSRGAWVRRKSKPQVESPEVKHAGTPKKRVVSDGHWRRDRPPKEETPVKEDKEKDTTPKPMTVRRSVANVGLKVPVSHQDFSDSDPEPHRARPFRKSRSRSGSPDGRGATPDFESSGTRVYIKRRIRSKPQDDDVKENRDPRKSESSFTAPSSIDKPSTATDITEPDPVPPKQTPKRPVSAPRERLEKSEPRESMPRPKTARPSPEDRIKSRNLEDQRLKPSKSAEAYAKKITEPIKKPAGLPASPVAPKVYGNRIEGWLANMPDDPFTESRSSLTPEPLDIPKRKSRRRMDTEQDAEDSGERRKSSGGRRSSRQDHEQRDSNEKDQRHADEDRFASYPGTPTGLKRMGARRKSMSPVKRERGESRETTPTANDPIMSGALPIPSKESSRNSSANTQTGKVRIPSGSRTLSTIMSIDTLQPPHSDPRKRHAAPMYDDMSTIHEGSVLSRASDGDSPVRRASGVKRRGTKKHADLISVLSRDDAHTIVSSRSMRASRRRPEAATVGDIMNELSADELKYQRELRSLVDGVIPVLLQHALAEPEKASGSRVLSKPARDTKPIVDMGIALERLKTTHRRIPMHEPSDLLVWADSASKVYADYLKVWRLGFKHIVVNLAPAEQTPNQNGSPAWDDGLPRNKDGDLVDGSGERVDVAYLLKRPLVRLKYLAKTFKGINQLQPSANSEDMTARYQDLILEAKKRVNDEQARLEDEAAASIDATRSRDPRSLAPVTGVTIDPTRSVRARDYFDMDLTHSSGQQLGCKIEIIYRDDAPDRGKAGDILVCEMATTGRWLLYPPLPISLVSAREGDRPGELVVMIRGFLSNARQWREIMSLQADDEATSADWLQMLGSSPLPPRLSRKSSFNMLKETRVPASGSEEPKSGSGDMPDKSRDPSPREVEVPLGERAKASSRIWDGSEVNSVSNDDASAPPHRTKAKRYRNTLSSPPHPDEIRNAGRDSATQPAYFYEQPHREVHSERAARRPVSGYARSQSDWTTSSITDTMSTQSYSVWLPSEDTRTRLSDESSGDEDDRTARRPSTKRPGMHRRTSSVPSLDMPSIPKVRKSSQAEPKRPESPSSDRDLLPSQRKPAEDRVAEPSSAPAKMQKRRLSMFKSSKDPQPEPLATPERAPQPPPHTQPKPRPMSLGLKSGLIPSLTPAFLKKDRRPSSPLKHEYEPSSASDSLSDSDYSDDVEGIESDTSESTVEEVDVVEDGVSTVGTLNGFQKYNRRDFRKSPPPVSEPAIHGETLTPSESASQSPYRSVPPTATEPAKTVADIFSWSERGSWDPLHPQECQIFVTPGLIEAFDLAQANAVSLTNEDGERCTPSSKGVKPLVALELTPLVPLRRGTAVDISVRSPPTAGSLIRTGNNVMFRSRSPEECEKLYALINRARIDNPTYIALQNARGPSQGGGWAEAMDRRNAARTVSSGTSRSWFNLGSRKSGSYRSKGSRTASIAATESSVGTMSSAFSALRRFSGGSRIFNIAKSTITSKEGTRSTNSESLSSGVATPVPFDPSLGTPLGITNAKIRLYVRDSPSKWRDMGAARLTVMLPPRQDPLVAANPKSTSIEKRILVYGKSKGETLLDVTLGESAFERVARTGIAVSVYEETDQVAATGGVLVAKTTTYLVQMKSERDAAYTFGLVGKLRY